MGRLLRELGRFDELSESGTSASGATACTCIAEFLYATGLRIAEACALVA